MASYVSRFRDGDKDQKDLLGGKGANLAEMTNLDLPVPPGFTITTEACRAYMRDGHVPPELRVEVTLAVREIEDTIGRRLGDFHEPLLVSVRSGAKFSMPGMMETVLNIGLNDASVKGLTEFSGDERFAWDSYRRLIQMFGKTVLGIDGDLFATALDERKAAVGAATDVDLSAQDLRVLVQTFKEIVVERTGREFPQHPREQLDLAIEAVLDSWNTDRARLYRRRERIPNDLGTAVNVVSMVFGNLGETSGTGVCFTRDPSTGETGVYGDYLPNAQGEDVVAGIRNTLPLAELELLDPVSYDALRHAMRRLETHYRDLCDIEFTIERGKLWLLQTRVGKRTAAAAFRIATELVDESLITMDEAITRCTGDKLSQLLFPQFDAGDASTAEQLLTRAMPASPGAAVGEIVLDNAQALERTAAGAHVILVRRETNPDDLQGMIVADGVLTARGGKTSHAAVVARGMGTCAVVGAEELDVDPARGEVRVRDQVLRAGDTIAIDGATGEVFRGEVPVVDSPVMVYVSDGLDAGLAAARDPEARALVTAVDRVLRHADSVRRMQVRTNADTAHDARRARDRGAAGGRAVPHRAPVPGRATPVHRAPRAGGHRRRPAGGARRAAPAAARRLRRAAGGDGRAADDHPAHRPAAARVPAGPHRAGGPGRRGRGARPAGRRAPGGRRADARAEPDARAARGPPRADAAGPVRAAGAGDRRGDRAAAPGRARPAARRSWCRWSGPSGSCSWSARRPSACSPRSPRRRASRSTCPSAA